MVGKHAVYKKQGPYSQEESGGKGEIEESRENQEKIRELFPWSGDIYAFQIDSANLLIS